MGCLFSGSSARTCSAVLLYWHLVGSGWVMGERRESAAQTRTLNPTKYLRLLFFPGSSKAPLAHCSFIRLHAHWCSSSLPPLSGRSSRRSSHPSCWKALAMPSLLLLACAPILWVHTLLRTSWDPNLWSSPPALSCWMPPQQPFHVSSSGSPCLDLGLTGLSGKPATTGVASCLVARAPALASEEGAASYPVKDFLHQFPSPSRISCPTVVPF